MAKTKRLKPEVTQDSRSLEQTIELGISLIHAKLLSWSKLEPEEIDSAEVYKLSNSLAGLTRSLSETRRLNDHNQNAIDQASVELQTRLKAELVKHPQLCEKLQGVVDSVKISMSE